MNTICVFCGSSAGAREEYVAAATAFGRLVAERGLTLVYGGASVGLMGAVADAALAAESPARSSTSPTTSRTSGRAWITP